MVSTHHLTAFPSAVAWLRTARCMAFALAACAGWAHAATPLMIWPVDPVITEEQQAVAVWLENRGTAAVSLQVRVLDWSQTDGEEFFSAQKDVVASPPISLVPAGKRQMVRLIAARRPPTGLEDAYRVVIDELPAPGDPAQMPAGAETGMGIRLNVRYAIPLFVYGEGAQPFRPTKPLLAGGKGKPLPPSLTWQATKQGNRHQLVVRNQGAGHARLTSVQWNAGSRGAISINEGLMGYVLPGSQMQWELEAPPPANPELKATINGVETLVPRALR